MIYIEAPSLILEVEPNSLFLAAGLVRPAVEIVYSLDTLIQQIMDNPA